MPSRRERRSASRTSPTSPFPDFLLGCNYFASHRGIFMWKDWDEKVVDDDFRALAAHRIDCIRIFPMWNDFQILTPHVRGSRIEQMRNGEAAFPDTPAGRACVDQTMADRLVRLLELAERHNLRVMIDMLNGWMSGRNFRPTILLDKSLCTDPLALKWQVRYVRFLVNLCKSHRCVVAWGLGNECNMGSNCPSRDAAWSWAALIADAIRSCDPTRPVVSSMHALAVAEDEGPWPWYIKDQAEHADILTTHPYPYYTPHSHRDRITANRLVQFPAAQSALYSDIGGKPSMTQELGLLGPMIADERTSADYLASVLWSLWTVADVGAVWWMAFDTRFIPETPYEWQAPEQELGFLTEDRKPKKMLHAMTAFKAALESLPKSCQRLPKPAADAVCLMPHSQENWTVAYSAFVMAKQAGFDIRFVHADDPLPESDFYMIPSIQLVYHIPRSTWAAIMHRVRAGASLYLSFSSAFVARFKEMSGIEVIQRQVRTAPTRMICGDAQLVIPNIGGDGREAPCKYDLRLAGGEVVCAEDDGSPILVRHAVGKGSVFTLLSAVELAASNKPGALGDDPSSDYAVLYRKIFARLIDRRNLHKRDYKSQKSLSLSEHVVGTNRVLVVGINHSGSPIRGVLGVGKSVKGIRSLRGSIHRAADGVHYQLAPHDAFVAEIRKGR